MRRPLTSAVMLAFSPTGRRFNRHEYFSLDIGRQFDIVAPLLDLLPLPDWPSLPIPTQHPNPTVKRKHTYAMLISYNGIRFPGGYEINPSFGADKPTCQGELHKNIMSVLGMSKLWVATAGRTDAKVSAKAGLVSFATREEIEPDIFVDELNASFEHGEIKIHGMKAVDSSFHASFGTTAREYLYILPILRNEYGDSRQLQMLADVADSMLSNVVGKELDYIGISAGKVKTATTNCTFHNAGCWYYDTDDCIRKENNVVPGFSDCWESVCQQYKKRDSEQCEYIGCMVFKVKSNRFLKRMMRKLINSVLLDASEVLETYQDHATILAAKDEWKDKWRQRVDTKDRSGNDAAPPEGLCLWRVDVL